MGPKNGPRKSKMRSKVLYEVLYAFADTSFGSEGEVQDWTRAMIHPTALDGSYTETE